jgi:hypothetical protein
MIPRAARRHARIVGYVLRSLARRWRKNLSVTVVYGVVIYLLASVVFLTQSLTAASLAGLAREPEIIVQKLSAGRHELIPVADLAPVSRIAGVRSGRARLWAYSTDLATHETVALVVPDAPGPAAGQVFPGREFLRRRSLAVGDDVRLEGRGGEARALKVAGVLDPATALESAALLHVSEATFRDLVGVGDGLAMDLALRVRNARELSTIATKVTVALPGTRPIVRDELARTYRSVFNWRSGVVIATLLVPVLAFVIFAWDKAAGLGAEERREIGVLKAVGWETGDVLLMKCYEAVGVSLAAFGLGTGLALGWMAMSRSPLVQPALVGWSTLYPSSTPLSAAGAYQVTTLFFLTVFPYLVATVIPAWRAATIDPDLVMRT